MDLQLAGRSALVTGASRGIGWGIAQALAREGCALTLVARTQSDLETAAADLRARHAVAVRIRAADLGRDATATELAAEFPDIDLLVNNAGAIPGGNLWQVDAARWRAGWNLKVFGTINLTRACYANMRARGGGVILNTIGSAGENYDFDYIAGTTGNAALMAFTRTLGSRSLRDGIRVLGVNPGLVATARIEALLSRRAEATLGDAARYPELLQALPLGRAASVEEVADLFAFLASPRAGYLSGTIVTIDGGAGSDRPMA